MMFSGSLVLISSAVFLAWVFGCSVWFGLPPSADYLAWPALLLFAIWWNHKNKNRHNSTCALCYRWLVDTIHNQPGRVCAVAAIWYVITCCFYAFRAYSSFQTGAFDLGVFDQVVYNLSQGNGYYSSLVYEASFLGDHFSPFLMILAPSYWIWPDPRMIILLQVLALAASAWPLYRLMSRLSDRPTACILVVLFLLSVPARRLATYHFHTIAFSVPVLCFALERLQARKIWQSLLCLLVAFTIKESVALGVAGVGLSVFFGARNRLFGSLLFVMGITGFLLIILYVIPSFNVRESYQYVGRYSHLGNSFADIVQNLITRPYLVYHLFWPPSKLEYLVRLLFPLALLPLVGWRWAVGGLLIWIPNSLTNYHPMHSIHFQNSAEILPFLWTGAAAGITKLKDWKQPIRTTKAVTACVVLSLLLSESTEIARAFRIQVTDRHMRIGKVLDQIPESAPVSAQFNLVDHLSHRHTIYLFPKTKGSQQVQYIALDERAELRPYNCNRNEYIEHVKRLPSMGYRIIQSFEGFSLWKYYGD